MNDISSAVEIIASLPTLAAVEKGARELIGKADSPEKLRQVAKGFESVLLMSLFEEMKRTIPEGGLFTDPTCKQMNDLFWHYLAEDLADQGGMGLSEQLYRQMSQMAGGAPAKATMEQLL